MKNSDSVARSLMPEASGLEAVDDGDRSRRDGRELILDAAEYLFGLRGVEGVSLREILAEAGQRNNNAVHYHFGDKQGLIRTLLTDRILKIEKMRQGLIDVGPDLSEHSEANLLKIFWKPLLDIDDGRGGHWFIRFNLSCHLQWKDIRHPISENIEDFPATMKIRGNLRERFGHLPNTLFAHRLQMSSLFFQSVVCWHDKMVESTNLQWSTRFSMEETIRMAIAAIGAPDGVE